MQLGLLLNKADSIQIFQQLELLCCIYPTTLLCFNRFFCSELKITFEVPCCLAFQFAKQNGLMSLNVNNCSKGTQRPFAFNQLSFSFPIITMTFWTTEVQSVILNFHTAHVAWSGVSILGLSCLDPLSI